MAALAKTYSFTPGTSIVAAQVNDNFDDVVDWATGAPALATAVSATSVSGTLAVSELATFSDDVYLSGSNQRVIYEGSSADAYESWVGANDATADRFIYLPDAAGTVSLIDNASNIISNTVFN